MPIVPCEIITPHLAISIYKVTANKNKKSQRMLRVKVFKTDFRYFFAIG